MKDRYLFRGKTISGDWVQGLLANTDDKWYISNKAGRPFAFEIRPESICQCTGLKDKNGNLIWENDIVKHYNDEAHPESYCTGTVLWDENYAGFYRTSNEYGLSKLRISSDCIYEVIGNQFDNPELLEGSNDGE